jgi:hypothetical protein
MNIDNWLNSFPLDNFIIKECIFNNGMKFEQLDDDIKTCVIQSLFRSIMAGVECIDRKDLRENCLYRIEAITQSMIQGFDLEIAIVASSIAYPC